MTSAQLQLKWAKRDGLYSWRRTFDGGPALSAVEAEAVVTWRRQETEELRGNIEKAKALIALSAWVSPRSRRT